MADTKKKAASGGKKSAGASNKKNTKGNNSRKRADEIAEESSLQGTLSDLVRKREFKAGVVFVSGLILLIITIFAGQEKTFWNKMHNFYFSLFGIAGCYIPAAVLFLGVVNVLNRNKPVYLVKLFEIFLLFICICGLIHINTVAAVNEVGFGAAISDVYYSIMENAVSPLASGGVVGALFGGALYELGRTQMLANILCILLMLAVMMLLFGITLFKLFTDIEKPVKKAGQYTGQAIENAKTDYEKRKKQSAEAKAGKTGNNPDDPTRVVNDFYAHNPDRDKKGKQTPAKTPDPEKNVSEKTAAEDPAPITDADIASIFDQVEARIRKKESENAVKDPAPGISPSAERTAEPAADNIFEHVNKKNGVPLVQSNELVDIQPENEAVPEQKKADPLTAEEAEKLNSELDKALEKPPVKEYVKPPLDCLKKPVVSDKNYDIDELKANGERLIAALNSFNVSASIVDVVPGPTVTRYELSPAPGVKISKFTGLADDLALHMAAPAGLRIEAPIPNKAAIGIEIPNRKKATVYFREIIDNDDFRNAKSKLNAALGKDISGDVVYSDIAKMPHLLVAGTTGSGKSVCMNTMIVSLLYNAGPDEVKIILIDPKQVEFGGYNGIPHLLVPVVSDPRKASGALGWAVTEMLTRYKTLNANGVRDITSYNSLCEGNEELVKMPQIVIFIDELADLMTVAPAEVEDSIQRIAQMGRAAGMHLVIATQRPSVDVITGVIKANIPSRIALTVKSQIDSRTMIDQGGAEKLMGYGDMLYYPVGVPKPIRVQGAFLSTEEIENIVTFLKANGESQYDDSVQEEIERQAAAEKKKGGSEEKSGAELDKNDDLLMRAIELFVSAPEKASISALQRHLGLGFAKAGRLMDTLEEKGVVGPTEGSKPRKVLITKAQWYEMNAMSADVTDADPASDFTSGSAEA